MDGGKYTYSISILFRLLKQLSYRLRPAGSTAIFLIPSMHNPPMRCGGRSVDARGEVFPFVRICFNKKSLCVCVQACPRDRIRRSREMCCIAGRKFSVVGVETHDSVTEKATVDPISSQRRWPSISHVRCRYCVRRLLGKISWPMRFAYGTPKTIGTIQRDVSSNATVNLCEQ